MLRWTVGVDDVTSNKRYEAERVQEEDEVKGFIYKLITMLMVTISLTADVMNLGRNIVDLSISHNICDDSKD